MRVARAGTERLRRIHEDLLAIIDEFSPAALSLERHFVAANVQSAFRLGEARAMAMLAAAERGLAMFEYPPNEVKLCVAGHGHADKAQVKYMVRKTLKLDPSISSSPTTPPTRSRSRCAISAADASRTWSMQSSAFVRTRARRSKPRMVPQ